MNNTRKGKGVSWEMNTRGSYTNMTVRGFTVDDLDTKGISEAKNHYEETFIRIRELLNDKPWCCDNQEDVLNICQAISDELKQNLLIRKD